MAARALFFTVADAAKIAIPIDELNHRGLLPVRAPLRVLDVGAGCGAMTLGLAAALPERALDVVAVDRDAAALAILQKAAARMPIPPLVTLVTGDASRGLPEGPFDLVVAGSVLNEVGASHRQQLLFAMIDAISPDGAVIVIEPALRETSRDLHTLRDLILGDGRAYVFAPCTRRMAPCPALADPRDWCHEDRTIQPPAQLRGLIQRTGLRAHGLKFAYLTLRRDGEPLVPTADGERALRVVSDAIDQKGTTERMVCGDEGRSRLRVLRRDRTEANRALGESRRGDVLVVNGAGGSDGEQVIQIGYGKSLSSGKA